MALKPPNRQFENSNPYAAIAPILGIISASKNSNGIAMANGPFYADSGWWQGVAAVAALFLSQVSPVRHWFKRPKLLVEPYERIAINHDVGLSSAQWHVSITNKGGRDVRVKKITLIFRRDGGNDMHLDGRGYFEKPSDTQAVLLTPFLLKPEAIWSFNIHFFRQPARETRQAYARNVKALRENIKAKRLGLPEKSPDVEGDAQFVEPFLQIFDSLFYWRAGEYEVELRLETDSLRANWANKYRFTIFEADSDDLRARKDLLKFGIGAVFPNPDAAYHFAEVSPSTRLTG